MRPPPVSLAMLVASLALVTACGGTSDDEPARPQTSTAASPSPSATPSEATSSATPSPVAESSGAPPTSGRVHDLGDRVRVVTGSTMTVFSWHRERRPGPAARGAWWAGDVKVCLTRSFGDDFEDPVEAVRSVFRVELEDSTALTPEADARTPDEAYAKPGGVLHAGRCMRGEVVFDIPAGPSAAYFACTISPFSWVRWQLA
jgi:hypothetical protein